MEWPLSVCRDLLIQKRQFGFGHQGPTDCHDLLLAT
jgi:hypothetical protein